MCKKCKKYFSINFKKKNLFWIPYIDGLSFRKLGDQNNFNQSQIYRKTQKEFKKLPSNTYITANYCNRWSGRLNVDGKYLKIKGFRKKIPFIYGIDFLTHDIPVGILAPSENTMAFMKFFSLLKSCKYNLQIVICDENAALEPALRQYYQTAKMQLCHVHFLENLRKYLNIRTEKTYHKFFFQLQTAFGSKTHPAKRDFIFRKLNAIYGRKDEKLQYILGDIWRMKEKLFAFNYWMKKCPCTNNIIESYNSHLNGRLKTIKGFQSFKSAEMFLNAWMLRRRAKPFTDCNEPFKHLNGKCSLEMSLKKELQIKKILNILGI